MDKLRHIALFTDNPQETAKFYQDVFDLEIAGPAGAEGVYLTDGYINLAILHSAVRMVGPEGRLGFDHFGFKVDDLQSTIEKLHEVGSAELPSHAPPGGGDFYYEVKYEGPNQQTIDITENGWVGAQ